MILYISLYGATLLDHLTKHHLNLPDNDNSAYEQLYLSTIDYMLSKPYANNHISSMDTPTLQYFHRKNNTFFKTYFPLLTTTPKIHQKLTQHLHNTTT